jgi:hypothetical protein
MSDEQLRLEEDLKRRVEALETYENAPVGGAGANHNILSATHTDTPGAAAVVRGDLLYGNATPKWDRFAIGAAHQILKMVAGATDFIWAAFNWDDIAAAVGADVTHDHSSAAEGGTIAAAALAHNVLSATHSDALAAAVVDGDTIIGNVTPKWSRLAISIPAANIMNYLGVNNAELRPSWKSASASPGAAAAILQSSSTGGLTLVGALEAKNLKATDFTASTLSIINASKVLISLANATGYLKNDGAGAFSYDTTTPPSAHNILSASHGDTLAAAIVDGDILIGNVTPKLSRLAISVPAANVLNYLGVNNTELRPSWKAASDTPGAAAKILQSNSTGGLTLAGALEAKNLKATDFTASTLPVINASKVLITLANAAGYLKNDGAGAFSYDAAPVAAHNILSATHTDAVGAAACVAGDLFYGNATPKWDRLAKGTAYQTLRINAGATAPEWANQGRLCFIAETVLGGSAGTFSFAAISQIYRHLVIMLTLRTDAVAELDAAILQFNADTGNNYDYQSNVVNNATYTGGGFLAGASIRIGLTEADNSTASAFSSFGVMVWNYTNANVFKTVSPWVSGAFGNISAAADSYQTNYYGKWRSAAAVTSIVIDQATGPNFATNSIAQLYGIL